MPERAWLCPSRAARAARKSGGTVRFGSRAEVMRLVIAAFVSVGLATPSSLSAQASSAAPDYAKDSSWLCLPGRKDVCSAPLPTTALNPHGYGSNRLSPGSKNPPVDCFYVHPTASNDSCMNSDISPGRQEQLAA